MGTLKKAEELKVVATEAAKPAGRIVHDARGNAVWSRGDSGSTSTMLRKLELPGLKVEGQDDSAVPTSGAVKGKATIATPKPDVSRGYNPYDQHKAITKPTTPKGPVVRRKA